MEREEGRLGEGGRQRERETERRERERTKTLICIINELRVREIRCLLAEISRLINSIWGRV